MNKYTLHDGAAQLCSWPKPWNTSEGRRVVPLHQLTFGVDPGTFKTIVRKQTDKYKNEIIKNLTESLVDSRSGFLHIYKKPKFCTLAKTTIRQQDSRTNKPSLPIKNTILVIIKTTNGTERHSHSPKPPWRPSARGPTPQSHRPLGSPKVTLPAM